MGGMRLVEWIDPVDGWMGSWWLLEDWNSGVYVRCSEIRRAWWVVIPVEVVGGELKTPAF